VDASFAVMALLLAAVDQGLGALFMGVFRGEDTLRTALEIPQGMQIVGAVVLGWPAPDDRPSASVARGRRPKHEVVHRGRYGSSA
jgi:nitroreductase